MKKQYVYIYIYIYTYIFKGHTYSSYPIFPFGFIDLTFQLVDSGMFSSPTGPNAPTIQDFWHLCSPISTRSS